MRFIDNFFIDILLIRKSNRILFGKEIQLYFTIIRMCIKKKNNCIIGYCTLVTY